MKLELWGLPINCLSLDETIKKIIFWAKEKEGKTVYCCTLNEVRMASEEPKIKKKLLRGDMLTADGMPLVWGLKMKGCKNAERVYGPELLKEFLSQNRKNKIRQLFIGNENNKKYFEKIGDYLTLPYQDRFKESDYQRIVNKIKNSQARVVWIGLGARKQILVADQLRKKLNNRVYVTVGAAFDFISGNKKQSPRWLRQIGGEWLFRLVVEPKRLGERYIKILRFIVKEEIKSIF